MLKQLCSFMFGTHAKCNDDAHLDFNIEVYDDSVHHPIIDFVSKQTRKIIDLEATITRQEEATMLYRSNESSLLKQIEELKAIHHYQTGELEKKIKDQEEEIAKWGISAIEINRVHNDEHDALHKEIEALEKELAFTKQDKKIISKKKAKK